jgi:hypothetical protein
MTDDDYVAFFGQRMRRDWAEMLAETQHRTHYLSNGRPYERIPYGAETFRDPKEAATEPCRHCKTIAWKLHEPRCDYEQCPVCNWQSMSCDCKYDGDRTYEFGDQGDA